MLGLEGKSLKEVAKIVGVLEKGCKKFMPTAGDIRAYNDAILAAKKDAAVEARSVAKAANIHAKKLEDELKALGSSEEEK